MGLWSYGEVGLRSLRGRAVRGDTIAMNVLSLVLAAALAAPAHAAEAPAPGMSAPEKTGSEAPALPKAQQELAKSMTHWALVCPPDAADPRLRDLAERLGALRARADQPLDAPGTQALQKDFNAWKDKLAALLSADSSDAKMTPAQFRSQLEKGVAGLAAIAEDSHISAQDRRKASAQIDTLRRVIGPVAANYYYDHTESRGGVGVIAQARAQGAAGTAKFFKGYTGQARVLNPAQAGPVPLELASYQPQSASGWSLKGVIDSVSSTARRYAGKVAQAIVDVSHKYGIDERLQAAFVWVESAFNPRAKSGAGAMGLGQLMPGTARSLGVRNPYDINQNLRGSASFVKSLLGQFSTPDELRYTQGLYAWGKIRVQRGESADKVWHDVFAKTPLGVKNAIAAYNAGSGAITSYAHGNYMNLPRKRTAAAQRNGEGYWQTVNYVPAVLRRYFEIYLHTPTERGGPSIFQA